MKTWAMIQKGVVQNIIQWDGVSTWSAPGFDVVEITSKPEVQIGWLFDYDDQSFSSP